MGAGAIAVCVFGFGWFGSCFFFGGGGLLSLCMWFGFGLVLSVCLFVCVLTKGIAI